MIYKNSTYQGGIKIFKKKEQQQNPLFTPTQISSPPFTSRASTSPIPESSPKIEQPSQSQFFIAKPQNKIVYTPILQNREIRQKKKEHSQKTTTDITNHLLNKHLLSLSNLRTIVSSEISKFKPIIDEQQQQYNKADPILKGLYEETKSYTNSIEISNFYDYTKTCMSIIIELLDSKESAIKPKKVKIKPEYNDNGVKKRLAVFDLDETIIHCVIQNYEKCNNIITIKMPTGKETKIGLNIRPYWKESMEKVMKYYTVIVYTASHQLYADAVLDYLDPDNKYFYNRLYRNNCISVKNEGKVIYVKDMDIFEGYELKDVIIIDNSVMSFAFHLENGIPIVPYYDAEHDVELMFCACYLENIVKCDDLREMNKKYMKLGYYLEEARKEAENEEEEEEEGENEDNDQDTEYIHRSQSYKNGRAVENEKHNDDGGCSTPNVRRRQRDSINAIKYYEFRSNWEKMLKKKGGSFINELMNDFEQMRKVFNKEMNNKIYSKDVLKK